MGFFRSLTRAISKPFRRKRKKPKKKPEYVAPPPPEIIVPERAEVTGGIEDLTGTPEPAYRVVDYQDVNGVWRNTDPVGQVTTDGSRTGQGDPEPTTEDIEASPWINVGFEDDDGEIYYKWIQGPFDAEFWIDDAIEQIVGEYNIPYGSNA